MLQNLPDLCYKSMLEQDMSDLDMKTLRSLSKECKSLIDATLTALKPRDFSSSEVTLIFCCARLHAYRAMLPFMLGIEFFLA